MKERTAEVILYIVLFIFCTAILGMVAAGAHNGGYKQGQIDAINGNVNYILVVNPDKSTSWELKKELGK